MWRIIVVRLSNAFESETHTTHFRHKEDGERVVRMLNTETHSHDSFPEYLWRLVPTNYTLNSED